MLHQFPQFENFLAQQALDASEFGRNRTRLGGGLAANHVHLHFDSDQRLHGLACALKFIEFQRNEAFGDAFCGQRDTAKCEEIRFQPR